MKLLDSLFEKAKNTPPPLSKDEAEKLIISAKIPVQTPKKFWTTTWGPIAVVAISSLTLLAVIINHLPYSTTQSYNSARSITAIDTGNGNRTISTETKPNTPLPANIGANKNKPNTTAPSLFISPRTKENANTIQKPILRSFDDEIKNVQGEKTYVAQESFNAVADSVLIPDTTGILNADTLKKLASSTQAPTKKPLYRPRNFIKTDILGYMYTTFPNHLFYGSDMYDVKRMLGNKYTIGYEREFTRRLSAGITFAYGMSLYTDGSGRHLQNTNSVFLYDYNYKGFTAIADARYYLHKGRRGSGFFIGPYLAYGFLEERIFLIEESAQKTVSHYTISTSQGQSMGWGLQAGYKLMFGRFFLEPLAGFIVQGIDKEYFDKAHYKQESIMRWRALRRLEISAGYSF